MLHKSDSPQKRKVEDEEEKAFDPLDTIFGLCDELVSVARWNEITAHEAWDKFDSLLKANADDYKFNERVAKMAKAQESARRDKKIAQMHARDAAL